AETDAVMINSERNLTLLQQSVPPVGEARADWELICGVAEYLGFGDDFAYKSGSEIFDEIRRFANPRTGYDLRGASYERLRETPLQWPCPPEGEATTTHGRSPIRYLNDGISQTLHVEENGHRPRLAFATPSRRAKFFARPHMDARELPDDDYPMVLNTGRLQHQWHTMTKTGQVDKLNKLNAAPFVEVHPEDAAAQGISKHHQVELTSRRGRAVLPVIITDRVLPGNVWVPFHWNDEHGEYLTINALTNDAVDPDSLQPELKVCAVRLRPIAVASPAADGGLAALGLSTAPPQLNEDESYYLSGFLAGLDAGTPGVPVLPASAPVRAPIRLWVDGLLAGTYSRTLDAPAPADDSGPMVLWASQTGTAEDFAAQLAGRLAGSRLISMNDASLADLTAAGEIVFVTSTFGDGGPPDNGAEFWERLEAADAPELSNVRYAVLGIGDKSYDNFCGHAKSLDTRLAALGATRILDRVDCEAYDDKPMAVWADRVIAGVAAEPAATTTQRPAVRAPTKPAVPLSRNAPVLAPLSRNTLLTPPSAAKEVRQFGFDISEHVAEHGPGYAVGDSLGVFVTNSDESVNAWLTATGLSGNEIIEVDGADTDLRTALTSSYDICRITPNLLSFVAERSREAKMLRKPRERLEGWLENRNGLDIVEEFTLSADPAEWQDALVRLTPRQYSISSSPLVSPHEVQLTVSVVRYLSARGATRGGVASTHLADRATSVPVFVQRSPNFRPPVDSETPMIMVGPGTGIAPFRGFLQERRALGHTGRNWLFFGDQHRAENFYYRDDLEHMVADGLLNHLDLAFSRDQAGRIYVQHKMLDAGAELWRWMEDGAHFYVCGDATRMARDVDDALTKIIRKHGSMSAEAAHDYKKELVATKRYVRDVY
ncbi:MAG: molybdopterin dinucleotide binding domain-containing protein, partial [Mycobacterium sp.]